jgi:hypothetical protein
MQHKTGERKELHELIASFKEKEQLNHSLIMNEEVRKNKIKKIKEKKRSTSQKLVRAMGAYNHF